MFDRKLYRKQLKSFLFDPAPLSDEDRKNKVRHGLSGRLLGIKCDFCATQARLTKIAENNGGRYNKFKCLKCIERFKLIKSLELKKFRKLKSRIRSTISTSLRRSKYTTKHRSYIILGESFDMVWKHLKLTWLRNYGFEWNGQPYHIDHIKPLKLANNLDELLALNKYTNLQLLSPKDNLSKGAKYEK